MNANDVKLMIEAEIAENSTVEKRENFARFLIEPVELQCAWDYGELGQTYPCWLVAASQEDRKVGIVYCQYGFGPKSPWGLIWLPTPGDFNFPLMGQDSGWFTSFCEAFDNAF